MDVYEVREYNLWDTSIVLTNDSNAVTKLPKIARLISKTTNITAKVSAEINKKNGRTENNCSSKQSYY